MRKRTSFGQLLALSAAAGIFGISVSASALTVCITGFSLSLDTVQPVEQSALPEMGGTYYLLSDYLQYGSPPAYPFNPFPGYPAFLLAAPDIFVIDDTTPRSLGSMNAMNETMSGEDLMLPDDGSGDEGDPGTNTPPITWPVSLDGLARVDPTNVLEFCTAYLYQDQFSTNGDGEFIDPSPYPGIPEFAIGAPVYALTTNMDDGLYLVDDTGLTRPNPSPPQEYIPQAFEPGTFYLQITNVGGGLATLRLNGVIPGKSYEILSCDPSAGMGWHSQKPFVADQDPAIITVPVTSTGSGLFWAREQNDLWLDILPLGTNQFNPDPGLVTVLLHNAQAGIGYALASAESLAGDWTLGLPQYATAGTNTLVFTLPLSATCSFFRGVAATLDTDQNGLPDYWELFYFGAVGVDPNADPDGDGWTNFQEWQNGTNPTVSDQPFLIIITRPAGYFTIP